MKVRTKVRKYKFSPYMRVPGSRVNVRCLYCVYKPRFAQLHILGVNPALPVEFTVFGHMALSTESHLLFCTFLITDSSRGIQLQFGKYGNFANCGRLKNGQH